MKAKRKVIIIALLLVIACIPLSAHANAKITATQLYSYGFSDVRDTIYSTGTFSSNTNPIYINLRQWDNSGYNYTVTYTVCKKSWLGDIDYCSYSSSVSNQNGPAVYAKMNGTPAAGSGRSLRIAVSGSYANGHGELYQN